MSRPRCSHRHLVPPLLAALALLLVACGEGGGETTATPPGTTATVAPTEQATASPGPAPTVAATAPQGEPPDAEILLPCEDGGICAVRADGSDWRRLAEQGAFLPAWSPDRTQIAYHAMLENGGYGLFVMDTGGSNRRLLTEHRGVHDPIPPVWSPDGRTIAIESSKPGDGMTPSEIWLVDMATGQARVFAEAEGFASNSGPAWSPDGRRIAFASDRGGNSDIWVANAEGSALVNLTENPAYDDAPAWLPNGRIAFFTDRDGNWELYVMQEDGTGLTNLSNHPGTDFMLPVGHFPPALSPDGTRIAFTSDRDGNAEVYVVDVDTGRLTRITDDPASDYAGSWLPDGEYVTFGSDRQAGVIVWVAAVDGSYLGMIVPPEDGAR